MKKPEIDNVKYAIDYIEYILNNCSSWREHQFYLVQAIEMLLKVYKSQSEALLLKCEYINEMKQYIAELHKKIESIEGTNDEQR